MPNFGLVLDVVRNKVILTKVVVLTMLDHLGPVHLLAVS